METVLGGNIVDRKAAIERSPADCPMRHGWGGSCQPAKIEHCEKCPKRVKLTTCPCGEVIPVPYSDDPTWGKYETCNIVCPKCHRHSTSGNTKTGEVSGWITSKDLARSNAEFQAQQFSADQNEFYGRGNW